MAGDKTQFPFRAPGRRTGSAWSLAKAIVNRSLEGQLTDLAAALSYYGFLSLPAILLSVVGLFALIVSPSTIEAFAGQLGHVVPHAVAQLVGSSLQRLNGRQSTSYLLTAAGVLLALWSSTGAVSALMRALNRTEGVTETRSFFVRRLVALEIVGLLVAAFALLFGGAVLGPPLSAWIGRTAHAEKAVQVVWLAGEWPLLAIALFALLSGVYRLAPCKKMSLRQVLPGAALAVVVWLLISALFGLYVSAFSSYNKTWGSLAAVIIMLTWLWLSAIAVLVGAELNSELAERRRQSAEPPPA